MFASKQTIIALTVSLCVGFVPTIATAHTSVAEGSNFLLVSESSESVPVTQAKVLAASNHIQEAKVSNNTLTFRTHAVRIVVQSGPSNDMLSYRIGALRNPTLIVPRGASLNVLFVNADDDMYHNMRFGPWLATYGSDNAHLEAASVGSPALPHKTEQLLHAERFTLRVPTMPGKYAYFCTVRGHAPGGMRGTVIVK